MKRTCPVSGRIFELRPEDLQFYERMDVPVPEIHPDEMLRQLMACRNEWKLYRRKCDKTGDPIISAYHSDVPFPVYKNAIWWGDSWDAMDYGRDFDLKKPFFEQFFALRNQVPREGTSVFNSENCDYNGHTRECKNCYMMGLAVGNEDCYYSYWVVGNKDIVDCRMVNNSELCYECVNCEKCFECVMMHNSANCNDCHFSYQLRGCDHCIGCNNLERKSYYIFNKKVTPKEFEVLKKQIFDGSHERWTQGTEYFQKMWDAGLHRYAYGMNYENCEGDVIINSKNCWHSFEVVECEDCAYNVSAGNAKNIYHSHSAGWPGCELVHSSSVTRGSHDIRFCYYTWFSSDLTYCDSCVSCQNCFGCVGLKHKQFCILNKQYSREEYLVLRDKIIAHMKKSPFVSPFAKWEGTEWGKFPPQMSTFAYNETAAYDYFPLTKKEVAERGYTWYEAPELKISGEKIHIPDSLHEVDDSICDQVLVCEKTGRQYKIQKGELEFYRRLNLPIPRLCPDARRAERTKKVNPYRIFPRKCHVCKKEILSAFSPERSEHIACEKCYLESLQ